MKNYFLAFATLLLSAMGFASCGDDDTEVEPQSQYDVVQRSCSIAEGEEVEASTQQRSSSPTTQP